GIGGDIVVRVTVNGGKIDNIEVLDHSETPDRGGKALELLQQEALDAQSAQIDVVSGATVTSDAFKAAVEEALSQAK
ncbi:MAG: FMN-binding protein, partial [Raoultibacter sp.]